MSGRRTLAVLAALLALAGAPDAHAVLAVNGSSLASALPTGRTAPTYTVRWTLTKSAITGPVFSSAGSFVGQPGQVMLGTNPAALFDPSPTSPNTVLTERVRLPANVIDAAQRRGLTITYTRSFQDSTAPFPQQDMALVVIATTGALGGPFQVLRGELDLVTDDGDAPLAVVEPGDVPRARAVLSYAGSGQLDAVWEVADAGSALGTPLFRPLRRVRRYLGSAGRVELESPPLPSGIAGLHLVRLRVLRPETAFALRPARYAVAAQPGVPPPPERMRVDGPAPRAGLRDTTRFRWTPRQDARAYQLEIYEVAGNPGARLPEDAVPSPGDGMRTRAVPGIGRRLTAVLLRPGEHEATLPALSRAGLPAGKTVLWRVRALDARGGTLAVSAPREIQAP